MLIDDIVEYFRYLNQNGFKVTCHFFDSLFLHTSFLPYNYHRSSYCLYVKSSRMAWDRCIDCQKRIQLRLKEVKTLSYYIGVCHAGIGEYVFPIRCSDGETVGFISLSGYAPAEKRYQLRRKRIAERYLLRAPLLDELWERETVAMPSDDRELVSVIRPLLYMLTMFCDSQREVLAIESATREDVVYRAVIGYLNEHVFDAVTLDAICAELGYSRSYVSHIFKRKSGLGILAYLNRLRMEQAKEFLAKTDLSIAEIATVIGYSDSNYFTNLFRKSFQISPRDYRKAFRT